MYFFPKIVLFTRQLCNIQQNQIGHRSWKTKWCKEAPTHALFIQLYINIVLNEKCMCWCFIDYWIEKCAVKHWNSKKGVKKIWCACIVINLKEIFICHCCVVKTEFLWKVGICVFENGLVQMWQKFVHRI